MKDIAASVLARLKNIANDKNIRFQQILVLFCQEELARKICQSKYNNKFILKGGFLIFNLSRFNFRPTIDSDYLLNNHSLNKNIFSKIITEIINIDTGNNFIDFEIKNFKEITGQMKYKGLRVNIIGKIKNTRSHLNLDFATGDKIVPGPEKRQLKTILPDFEKPIIYTYSLESLIAEKLDAIISRMETTSRMKDFYDIYFLAQNFDFEGRKLQAAIYETLTNRGTPYEKDSVKVLRRLTTNDLILNRWNNFCAKVIKQNIIFKDVINLITTFLSPPFAAIINEKELFAKWKSNIKTYI